MTEVPVGSEFQRRVSLFLGVEKLFRGYRSRESAGLVNVLGSRGGRTKAHSRGARRNRESFH